jgi:hypothetical protein
MEMQKLVATLALFLAGSALVQAQDRFRLFGRQPCPPAPCVPCPPATEPRSPMDPNAPLSQGDQAAQSPFNQALASAGEGGTQPAASYAPGFFGDLLGGGVVTFVGFRNKDGGFNRVPIIAPDVSQASSIKISDGDSPRPLDRVFYNYNFYGDVRVSPVPTVPPLDVNRHVFGFEKTLLGGDASIGMRLPFFSMAGSPTYSSGFIGDLSIITKYAFINNRQTGNVLSGGAVITAPSGGSPDYILPNGTRGPAARNFPVLLQPYAGYIYNLFPRLYFHGFHSVIVPTNGIEPTFMANDLGLGLWLFRDPSAESIRGLVSTAEIHVNTPLNHRDVVVAPGQTFMLDSTSITSGLYLMLPRAVIGGAVGVPLGFGPQAIEAIASVTLRF